MKTHTASRDSQFPIVNDVAKAIRTQRLMRGVLIVCVAAFGALAAAYGLHSIGVTGGIMEWGTPVWAVLCLGAILFGLIVPGFRRVTSQAVAGKIEQAYPKMAERLSTASDVGEESAYGSAALLESLHQQLGDEAASVAIKKVINRGRLTPWACAAGSLLLLFVVGLSASPSFRQFSGRFFHLSDTDSPAPNRPVAQPKPVRLRIATLVAKPPAYVNAVFHPAAKTKLPGAVNVIEFSALQVELTTDRPFRSARLDFTGKRTGKRYRIPIHAKSKARKHVVILPRLPADSYQTTAHFESDQGVASDSDLGTLTVLADAAPRFIPAKRFGVVPAVKDEDDGKPKSEVVPTLSPKEYLPIAVEVEDREGVEQIELQFTINDGPMQSQLLAIGEGRLHVGSHYQWPMSNLVKDGDVVRYRVKAFDNRRVPAKLFTDPEGHRAPEANLTPHVIFDPPVKDGADQWFEFRIDSGADSFERQNLIAQNEWLTKQLNAIRAALRKEQIDLKELRDKTKAGKATDEDKLKLAALEKVHRQTREELERIAKGIEQTWPMQQIGKESRAVAQSELKPSGDMLKAIPRDGSPKAKLEKFAKVDAHLDRAQKRLENLAAKADQLTKNYLDQMDLADLASKEDQLADKTGELAKKNPNENKQKLDELKGEQEKIRQKVDAMAEKSEMVKNAIESAKGKQLQALAKQAESLALKQQGMNKELDQSSLKAGLSKLEKIIRAQKDIVGDSEKERDAAGEKAFSVEPGNDAVIKLESRLIQNAMEDQLRFGRSLEAWANRLAPGQSVKGNAADARSLAKQQSKVLTDLVQFAKEFVKYPPLEFDKRIAEIKAQQKDVRKQMDVMWASLVRGGPKSLLDKARNGLSHATLLMDRNQFMRAKQHMEIGIGALNEIAKTSEIPPPKQLALPENATERQKHAFTVRKIAARQYELRNETAKLLQMLAQMKEAQARRLKEQLKQKRAAEKLRKELQHMAQHTKDPDIKRALTDAAKMTKGAEAAMKKTEDGIRKQDPMAAKKSGNDAEDLLKKTSSLAGKTAVKMMVAAKKAKADEAGMAFKQGQKQLQEAKKQLAKGNLRQAQSAMKNAAQALRHAAQKALPRVAKSSKPGPPNQTGRKPSTKKGDSRGPLSTGMLPDPRLEKDAMLWGKLAGKLPTELVQVMRARYGDDYAQIIQRYFQQIADVPIADRKSDK